MSHPAEEIERRALEEMHALATPELIAEIGIESDVVGSAFVSRAKALPASAIVINRAIGIGLDQPETNETLTTIVDGYDRADIARYFVQVHPDAQPENISEILSGKGLERARGWQKFSRGREVIDKPQTNLTVREVGPENGAASARIVCDAFDLGDEAMPWLAILPGSGRWHVFMTFDGDEPAGSGALFIDGDTAWTDFGATAPSFRKRGSQRALLQHRVAFALDHGCKQIFTCTGEDIPGDPQHSYSNILRCGFREDYVRLNFAPPKKA